MNKNKTRNIAINGILIALMIAMTTTMLVTGGVAILPLLVLVVGSILMGKWTAVILGFTFGFISFASALIFPSYTAPLFQNPLVSILPRVLIGIIGYLVFKLSEYCLKKINDKKKKPINAYLSKSISTALGAIFVVLFNTLLVILMIFLLYFDKSFSNGLYVNKGFVLGLISLNFVIEIILTPVLAVPVVFGLDKFLKMNKKQVVTQSDIDSLDNEVVTNFSNSEVQEEDKQISENIVQIQEQNRDIDQDRNIDIDNN